MILGTESANTTQNFVSNNDVEHNVRRHFSVQICLLIFFLEADHGRVANNNHECNIWPRVVQASSGTRAPWRAHVLPRGPPRVARWLWVAHGRGCARFPWAFLLQGPLPAWFSGARLAFLRCGHGKRGRPSSPPGAARRHPGSSLRHGLSRQDTRRTPLEKARQNRHSSAQKGRPLPAPRPHLHR